MDYAPSLRQAIGSVAVVAMGALAVGSLGILNDWVGDLGAFLWVCAGFFIPFVTGIALGNRAMGASGRAMGAVIGAVIVLLPTIGYALIQKPDLAELQLPLLWATFTPLALAQGAIAIPVAAKRRS